LWCWSAKTICARRFRSAATAPRPPGNPPPKPGSARSTRPPRPSNGALDGKPFAIIQRWHIADNSDQDKDQRPIAKPMLAVTRLPPGAVCHVAYIDVKANPNANELARKAADENAHDFKCGKDKVKVIGESGRAVELTRR